MPVVVHCFTGNRQELEQLLAMGYYIGITGWVREMPNLLLFSGSLLASHAGARALVGTCMLVSGERISGRQSLNREGHTLGRRVLSTSGVEALISKLWGCTSPAIICCLLRLTLD